MYQKVRGVLFKVKICIKKLRYVLQYSVMYQKIVLLENLGKT